MKNLFIGILGLAVVGLGGLYALKSPSAPTFGAISSPDIPSPYFSYGDVQQWAAKTTSLNQASSTVCALQAPAGTSTLQFASVNFGVSSSSAITYVITKSDTTATSSTVLGQKQIGAGAQGVIIASSTPTSGNDALVFGPNQYVSIGMLSGAGTVSPTGTCEATWTAN